MKKLPLLLILTLLSFTSSMLRAQDGIYDVFVPISKYLEMGDTDRLSAWFADNLEISIISKPVNSSKKQACQILNSFFDANTPRSFEITHTTGKGNMKYALGILNAGGERYFVTIFINLKDNDFKIQQIKIDRMQ